MKYCTLIWALIYLCQISIVYSDRGTSPIKWLSNDQYTPFTTDEMPVTDSEPDVEKKDTLLEDILKLAEILVTVYENDHKNNPNESDEATRLLLEDILMMVEPNTTSDTWDSDRQNHLTNLESNDGAKITDDVDLSILNNFNKLILKEKNKLARAKALRSNLNLGEELIKPMVLKETKRPAWKFWGKKRKERGTKGTNTRWRPFGVTKSRKFKKKNETHTHHRSPLRPVTINLKRHV